MDGAEHVKVARNRELDVYILSRILLGRVKIEGGRMNEKLVKKAVLVRESDRVAPGNSNLRHGESPSLLKNREQVQGLGLQWTR